MLTDEKYQNKVAKAICSGTLEYLNSRAEKSENNKNRGSLRSLVINLHLPIAHYSSILLSDVKK